MSLFVYLILTKGQAIHFGEWGRRYETGGVGGKVKIYPYKTDVENVLAMLKGGGGWHKTVAHNPVLI